jgi:hypothetical protein
MSEPRLPLIKADPRARPANTVVLALLAALLDLEQRRVVANVRHPLEPTR